MVWELSPPAGGSGAWTAIVLRSFTGGSDGAYPHVGLVLGANGVLYGSAYTFVRETRTVRNHFWALHTFRIFPNGKVEFSK